MKVTAYELLPNGDVVVICCEEGEWLRIPVLGDEVKEMLGEQRVR